MPCPGTGRRGLVERPRELWRGLSKDINTTEKTDPNAVTVLFNIASYHSVILLSCTVVHVTVFTRT